MCTLAASPSIIARPCLVPRARFERHQYRPYTHMRVAVTCRADRASVEAESRTKAPPPLATEPFTREARARALKLHAATQVHGGEGRELTFRPTIHGVVQFLVESKAVYDAFEDIVATDMAYCRLEDTGLERGDAIARDLGYIHATYPPATRTGRFAGENGMGSTYAGLLRRLAREDPPAFLCHYYSFYFAHMAGGRMMGNVIGEVLFHGWVGEFYAWDADADKRRESLRALIDDMAAAWTTREREEALRHVPVAFAWTLELLDLISL